MKRIVRPQYMHTNLMAYIAVALNIANPAYSRTWVTTWGLHDMAEREASHRLHSILTGGAL